MTPGRIIALILLIVVAFLGFVNYAVNAATEVNLLFKVPLVGAWALEEAVSLPILLAVTFGIGALLFGGALGIKLGTASRRLRNLRRQVAALQEELDYNRRAAKSASSAAASVASPAPATAASADLDDLI